jgi:hypothetical protein
MIHMYTGAEVQRNTKTACKVPLESLPRQHGSVPYKSRAHITCDVCAAAAAKIANMRGDK